jgi:hypothetical protein
VLLTRKTFQSVMGDELTAGIEEILGRKVIAFLSANHVEPDIAVETFILAPADEASLERSARATLHSPLLRQRDGRAQAQALRRPISAERWLVKSASIISASSAMVGAT